MIRALPRLYMGTMTFGWSSQTSSIVDESVALTMLNKFLDHEKNVSTKQSESGTATSSNAFIDTARIYACGKTESIIGTILPQIPAQHVLHIGTKAHPSQPDGLAPKGMRRQLEQSMEAMGMSSGSDSIHEFYLHSPDPENSLLESLKCANELIQEGKIEVLAMSNYHASEMKRAFDLCQQFNLVKPTVYQGLYNPLNRMVESELLSLLREHWCKFVAYNPLAAGLLTGKHSLGDANVKDGRFKNNPNYLPRFYTPSNHAAIESIRAACDQHNIPMTEATFRWILCHSALGKEDGVLLGASSMEQLEQNLQACEISSTENGLLPPSVLKAFENAWELTAAENPFAYWRSYSSDMPDRLTLDHGASYAASKK